MKKKILIIRSVSFQQLDKNIKEIVTQFPGHDIHLLTHSHGISGARGYSSLTDIIDYGSRRNFSVFHIPPSLKRLKNMEHAPTEQYDAVVVPVTNITGAGFLNVLLMCLRIPARSIRMCNLVSEIWEIHPKTIVVKAIGAFVSSLISAVLSIPFLMIVLPVLFIFHLGRRKTDRLSPST